MTCHTGNSRGFTLVEVLVAFTILAFSLAALLPVFSDSMRATRVSGEYAVATAFAQSRIAEYDATGEEGVEEGLYADAYHWRLETKRLSETGSAPRIDLIPLEVSVTVEWGAFNQRSVTLATVRLAKP